jgi:hypothetical protein
MRKLLGIITVLLLLVSVNHLNAQTNDAWYDGGSLYNVDMCDHNNPLTDFGFEFLYWDLNNIRSAYDDIGMNGPVQAISKQLEKLESWLGEHGDGEINFDVRNQSKVDNIFKSLMEIGEEIYWYGIDIGNNDVVEAGLFLYYDAEHCLNSEYWN